MGVYWSKSGGLVTSLGFEIGLNWGLFVANK